MLNYRRSFRLGGNVWRRRLAFGVRIEASQEALCGGAGFTLVEVLVVIAIIGLLIALLLPAVQACARAAARRSASTISNRLALLLVSYHDTYGSLPPGYVSQYDSSGNDLGPGWGWAAILLPQLEQTNIFVAIQFPLAIEKQTSPAAIAARTTNIATYLCPSDTVNPSWMAWTRDTLGNPVSPICEIAAANYVAMFGSTEPGVDGDGLFYRNSGVRFADVTDGLAQTIAVGERSHFLGVATWTGSRDKCRAFRRRRRRCGPRHPENSTGMVLGHAGEKATPGAANSDVNQFYSFHGQGANFLFMDGHCSFIPTSVDYPTYQAMATRAGGETMVGAY